ncbi:MAG: hypothetical protein GX219_06025 [Tissierellia bacterium]|nr:hypothetical protein [Tissierellia bacterium]
MLMSAGFVPSYLYNSGIIPKYDKDRGLLKQKSIIQSQIDRVSSLNISDEDKTKRSARLNELLSSIDKKIQESEKGKSSLYYNNTKESNPELKYIQGLYGDAKLIPFFNKTRMLNSLLGSRDNLKNGLLTNDSLMPESLIERKINSLTGTMIRQSREMNNLLSEVDFSDGKTVDGKEENKKTDDVEKLDKGKDKKATEATKEKDTGENKLEKPFENKYLKEKLSTYKYFSLSNVATMLKNNYKQESEIKVLDLAL